MKRAASPNNIDSNGSGTAIAELPDLESPTSDKESESSESLPHCEEPIAAIELAQLTISSLHEPVSALDQWVAPAKHDPHFTLAEAAAASPNHRDCLGFPEPSGRR
jgi:hypothetical protein